MDVLVFVTSVTENEQVNRVQALLTAVPAIEQWNFDLDDCDNILRIESTNLNPREVELLLAAVGIECRELEY